VWIAKYIRESRQRLVCQPDDRTLFLSNAGEPFSPDYLTEMVAGYVEAAQVGKRGACHLFRHTMATLMLEGGADARVIQAMLGHADLKTADSHARGGAPAPGHPQGHASGREGGQACQGGGQGRIMESMAELHMTEAEVARDFRAVLDRIRNGAEIVVERDAQTERSSRRWT
jgi:Phage integrase family